MDLVEELKAAHQQYLQDEWDKWLLEGWRRASVRTDTAIKCFMKHANIDFDTFCTLKRTPTAGWQLRSLLTRFVAAHLPILSEVLWNGNATDEQILLLMKSMTTQTELADKNKVQKESYERYRARKAANAENAAQYLVKGQREYTARSNWKHCK